jgi:1-phosphofructokinase
MIYTVTLNPSLDYIVTVPDLVPGQVNRTTEEKILPGGKGLNVSMVLQNLGVENVAYGFAAGFTGQQLRSLMEAKGIESDLIEAGQGMTRINVKIRGGRETEINGQGPIISSEETEQLYRKLETLKKGDILVLAGSIPGTMPATMYFDIMTRVSEKEIDIVVDASGESLEKILPARPFLIKPNHHELGEICGEIVDTKEKAARCAQMLQERGARNVLVSMAAEGAVLVAEDGGVYYGEAPEGTVVNSVGAGDSMVAGFLAGYLEKRDYEQALAMGLCAGSASAFSEELATEEAVQKLMREK